MQASGVTYASEINIASAKFDVSPALLQAILDFTGLSLFELPTPAQDYARVYAATSHNDTADYDGGVTYPEANIVAMAWYLRTLRDMYIGEWTPVALYFGDGPLGEQKARRVAGSFYPARKRAWA